MKEITPEDKENLSTLMADERWKAVGNSLDVFLENAKEVCCMVKEDHRFFQGRASMIIDLQRYFDLIAKPHLEVAIGPGGSHTNLSPRGYRRVAGSY
jgi:hypothetical protein